MKRPRDLKQWWGGGKPVQRQPPADPITPSGNPDPNLLRDPVTDLARSTETFVETQIKAGMELVRGNLPVDTAADLENLNLALELKPELAQPEGIFEPLGFAPTQPCPPDGVVPPDPTQPDPLVTDPMQPGMDPIAPGPKPGG